MHSQWCQRPPAAHTKLISKMMPPPAFETRMQKSPSPQQAVICAAATRAAVGIDLGTTNSVVAVLREGDKFPKVLHDVSSGTFTVPSVVAYTSSADSPLVGAAAKQQAVTNSRNTFYSVKRLMGRSWEDAQEMELAYQLQQAAGGAVGLVCPALQTNLCPQQVSSEILKYLLSLASNELGTTPQQVVITVPAYFTTRQRAATLEAAQLAGIKQVSLLQEPVAAAMAFGFGKPCDADTLLVFDLGGGTYDLSVVDSFEGIMEVLATGGDARLGGDDFDQAILQGLYADHPGALRAGAADDLCSNGSSRGGLSMSADMQAQLLKAVEAAKCQLSMQSSASILMPGTAAAAAHVQSGQSQQPQELTQLQMHKFTAPLRSRLWSALQPLADSCKLQYACEPSRIEDMLQQVASSEAGISSSSGGDSNSLDGSNGSSSSTTTTTCSSAEDNSRLGTPTDPYAPKPRKLTAVLLVGGATRMPIIQRGLQVLTGLQPRHDVDPEQAVALGASIYAAVLLGLSSGVELMDGSYVEEMHQRSTGF